MTFYRYGIADSLGVQPQRRHATKGLAMLTYNIFCIYNKYQVTKENEMGTLGVIQMVLLLVDELQHDNVHIKC